MIKNSLWRKIAGWEYSGLLLIIAVTLAFHFAAIQRPPSIIWDEVWYAGDARSIITGNGDLRPEHPPLAKLFIVAGEYIFNNFSVPEKDTGAKTRWAIGSSRERDTVFEVSDASVFTLSSTIRIDAEQMDVTGIDFSLNRITVVRGAGGSTVDTHPNQQTIYVFTDHAFGWRFFAVIFGAAGIGFFYLICRRLKFSKRTSLIATFLLAAENMTFLQSGLALLDVYMVTFMLGAVWFYLRENYLLAGVFIALSAQCKLVGVLIIFALFLHWAIYRRDNWQRMVGLLAVSAAAFVACLVFCDYLIKGVIENPYTRINELLTSTTANQFTVPKLSISSRPWTWLYPQWVQVYDNSPNVPFIIYSFDPQYISFISTTIHILIVPTIGYMVYKAIKGSQAAGLIFLWFVAAYLVWIPVDIATNRVTFVYYFLPVTPAICIGLSMGIADALDKLKSRRTSLGRMTHGVRAGYAGIALYLLIHLAIFVVFNPAIPPIIKTWLPPFGSGS